MNELILHIEYLLLRHDWVVVPGLGSFVREHKPAFYDSASRIWFPAREQVSFVSGRFPEDKMLLISYCRKYGISRRNALELLNQDTEELKNAIRTVGRVEFPDFGIFILSTSGNIVFRSVFTHEENNLLRGLLPVSMYDLENNDILTVAKNVKEENIENEEVVADSSSIRRNSFSKVRRSFFRTAACFMLLVIASLSFVVPTAVAPKIPMAEPVALAVAQSHDLAVEEVKSEDSKELKEEVVPEEEKETILKYHLIVGTFRNISEAEHYIKTRSINNDELRCLPTKTLVRVACASSDNIEELQTRLNSKSFKAEYKEAWIWSNSK